MNSGEGRNTNSYSDVTSLLDFSLLRSEGSDFNHYNRCVPQTDIHGCFCAFVAANAGSVVPLRYGTGTC